MSLGRIAELQPVGDRDQQPVADGVPEAVVHDLEAVEVEEQHRDALAALASACAELAAEALDELQRGSAARSAGRGPPGARAPRRWPAAR